VADRDFTGGLDRSIVRAFRKIVGFVVQANDERDLYAYKALHFEKLKGNRSHQRSLRLNKQFRLIIEIRPMRPKNVVVVIGIEDYH
jgi:proteic killer suppression protein